jgi:hypothetical protein
MVLESDGCGATLSKRFIQISLRSAVSSAAVMMGRPVTTVRQQFHNRTTTV